MTAYLYYSRRLERVVQALRADPTEPIPGMMPLGQVPEEPQAEVPKEPEERRRPPELPPGEPQTIKIVLRSPDGARREVVSFVPGSPGCYALIYTALKRLGWPEGYSILRAGQLCALRRVP